MTPLPHNRVMVFVDFWVSKEIRVRVYERWLR
jgi:hypothetical protein